MIKRIKKITALILISSCFLALSPLEALKLNANAAVLDKSEVTLKWQDDKELLSVSDEEDALETVEAAMLPAKLNSVYSSVSKNSVISEYEECGSLSYTLNDNAAESIAQTLSGNMSKIISGVTQVKTGGEQLIALGQSTGSQELIQKGTKLKLSAAGVLTKLYAMGSLSEDALIEMVKTEAEDIPVYKYKAVYGGSISAQGFAVGGTLGLALNPVETFNATEKNADYSSLALVPSLDLSGSSAYENVMDLNSSNLDIICDGLNINIIDDENNKIYVVNNPVYNMLQISKGAKSSSSKDVINIIDFSGVTNLKGSTSSINLSSEGITTSILGVSLTTKESVAKKYKYAMAVYDFEKAMLDDYIDGMNLSTIGTTIQGMIKSGTYTMIPNLSSEIGNIIDETGIGDTIDNVTDSLDDLSDSIEDLSDSLDDKNSDVNEAWDKVFDRFDNDEGWGKRDGYIYYYDEDGVSLKGVQNIKGKTYYFNRIDGAMETGWQIVDGKRCYFDKKKGYQLFNQWIQDGQDWYYVGEDGPVKKMEWITYNGSKYYSKADGKRVNGWFKIEDYWYFFNDNGQMAVSTWKWSDEKWYYLRDNGAAANDWLQIDSKWYYFEDPSGEMKTGWFRADGSWYCANADGSMKTGWAESSDGLCYLDENTGKMKKNEWVTVDGKTYYFNINGIMVTGSRYIDGEKYYFNSDGSLM